MQRCQTVRLKAVRFSREGLFALALLAASLSLGGCSTAPEGRAQLFWPVGTTYTVQSGDTLSEIADDYNLSEVALIRYNGLSDPDHIYVGQVLRVPPNSYAGDPVPVARPNQPASRKTEIARASETPHKREVRAARVEPAQIYSAPVHFIWPVMGHVISPFGVTSNGGRNDGINIAARPGQPIRAAASGLVIYAGDELKGYGNLVLIRHSNGYVTAYAHAQSIEVSRGAHVTKGQIVAHAGSTGDVSRPQVHFEIRRGVRPVNPKPLLMASNGV